MSEILVNCPNCSAEYQIPPHVTMTGLKCLECGIPMSAAVARTRADQPAIAEVAPACQFAGEAAAMDAPIEPRSAPQGPLRAWFAPDRDLSSLVSGAVFLLVGGMMVGFQYLAPNLEPYAHEYLIVRNVLAVAAVVLMAHSAAQDGVLRGLLCVFFPPYLLLYATSQEESGWLRGLFMGVLLGLCAEAFLLPEASLILEIGPAVSALIAQVESWMALASRPPV